MSDPKRYDGAKILGRLSGLGEDAVKGIWAEVKANSARIEGCAGPHDFGPLDKPIGGKRTCSKCQGWARAVDVIWYEKGLAHGRAS